MTQKYGYGLTTWSPLGFGVLTGKYSKGIPEVGRLLWGSATFLCAHVISIDQDSRLTNEYFRKFVEKGFDEKVAKTDQLAAIASEIGCSVAQLAIAWCTLNDKVSTVILGASRISQLDENLDALEFVEKITPEIRARIDAIIEPKFTIPKPDQYLITRRNEWL